MKTKFAFILLLLSVYANAQNRFFVELAGNYPLISDVIEYNDKSNNPSNFDIKFDVKITNSTKLGAGVYFSGSYNLGEKYELDYGLGFTYIRRHIAAIVIPKNTNTSISKPFEERTPHIQEGTPIAVLYKNNLDSLTGLDNIISLPRNLSRNTLVNQDSRIGKTTELFLSVPISFNRIITDRFRIGIGLNASFIVYSSNYGRSNYDFNEIVQYKSVAKFNRTILSGLASAQYKLFEKFWVSTNFQYAFSEVYDGTSHKGNFRLLNLGVRYYLK